jgi:DNA-binding response OmpR family regulator
MSSSFRVLVIEDDADLAANLCEYLSARGFAPEAAYDGMRGLGLACELDYEAIVLDLLLPRLDGLELLKRLREECGRDTPVLVLSVRDRLEDKLEAFECGADDYLVKPFELREVEARLRALHRRRERTIVAPRQTIRVGDIVFDPYRREAYRGGTAVVLTPLGWRLLEVFVRQAGRVLSREELERALWGEAQKDSERLRSQIRLLRRALARSGVDDPIETVHGVGYRLRVRGDEAL